MLMVSCNVSLEELLVMIIMDNTSQFDKKPRPSFIEPSPRSLVYSHLVTSYAVVNRKRHLIISHRRVERL